jgi:hypothetical protein
VSLLQPLVEMFSLKSQSLLLILNHQKSRYHLVIRGGVNGRALERGACGMLCHRCVF